MKVSAVFATLSSVALGASIPESRDVVNAAYQLFGGFNCAAPNYGNFQVTGGGPSCLPFASSQNVKGINVSYKNLKYQFIVFEKADCSDPGTILGTGGCYSHEAGLKAIKLVPF